MPSTNWLKQQQYMTLFKSKDRLTSGLARVRILDNVMALSISGFYILFVDFT